MAAANGALMYYLFYLPGLIGKFRRHYGRPEFVGRLHWYKHWSGTVFEVGPIYIGPIPDEDAPLWPEAVRFEREDFYKYRVWRNSQWDWEWMIDYFEREMLSLEDECAED